MENPLKITFRNMPSSVALENTIREKAVKLDSFYDRIMSCRVTVEAPHRHHHKGKAYQVRIDITVPGGELAPKCPIQISPNGMSPASMQPTRTPTWQSVTPSVLRDVSSRITRSVKAAQSRRTNPPPLLPA